MGPLGDSWGHFSAQKAPPPGEETAFFKIKCRRRCFPIRHDASKHLQNEPPGSILEPPEPLFHNFPNHFPKTDTRNLTRMLCPLRDMRNTFWNHSCNMLTLFPISVQTFFNTLSHSNGSAGVAKRLEWEHSQTPGADCSEPWCRRRDRRSEFCPLKRLAGRAQERRSQRGGTWHMRWRSRARHVCDECGAC